MIDFLLFLLFFLSIVYCCNLPLVIELPILICNKESIVYDIAIGIISAYVFYVIQIVIPKVIKRLKNKKLILQKLYKIRKCMIKTIEIVSGTTNYSIDKSNIISEIETYLSKSNVFKDETNVYQNGIELPIIDALKDSEDRLHNEIMELISLNIIDEQTLNIIMKIEKLELRDCVGHLSLNKEGDLITIKQKLGKSTGGYLIYNKEVITSDIIKYMIEYIDVLKSLVEFENKQIHKFI